MTDTTDNTEDETVDNTPVFSRHNFIASISLGAGFALLLVAGFIASQVIGKPFYEVTALKPDSPDHLINILTFPFAHLSVAHLISNLLPLAVLLLAMGLHHVRESIVALVASLLLSGLGVWLFESPDNYVIGASGILASMAVCALYFSIRDRAPVPGAIGGGIILITLASVLTAQEGTSIIAHLSGLGSGVILVAAFLGYRFIKRLTVPSSQTERSSSESGNAPSA